MEDVIFDDKLFLSYDLQHNLPNVDLSSPLAALDKWEEEQTKAADNYKLLRDKTVELFGDEKSSCNRGLYNEAMDRLERKEIMYRIQSLWEQEEDYASDDDVLLVRANDYIHALYTQPTDQLASFVSTLGFRGKYLSHWSYEDRAWLCLRGEIDYRSFYPACGNLLFIENIVVPFDAQSIWDALLLLLSRQWMWKPKMWFIADVDGKKLYPRITIDGNDALVTFCTVSAEPMVDTGLYPIYKNGVLLSRAHDTFSVEGVYRMRIAQTDDPHLPEAPEQIPPFHLYSEEEQRLMEEARSKADETDDLPF